MSKAQKPLTLEEAKNAEYVYLEDKDKAETLIALVDYVTDAYIMFRDRHGKSIIGSFVFYGKRWRAWAHRPTDARRAAAAWEDKAQ